jgi:hypothetical protein
MRTIGTGVGMEEFSMLANVVEECVVAIASADDDRAAGTGFRIESDIVITCTHVVRDALGCAVTDLIGAQVKVVDKFANLTFTGTVAWFKSENEIAGDFSIITTPNSLNGKYATLLRNTPPIGADWRSFGFPKDFPRGAPIEHGRVGSMTGDGQYMLIDTSSNTLFVEPGYSGAPVWDVMRRAVIGLVAEEVIRGSRHIGLMIPSSAIIEGLTSFGWRGEFQDTPTFSKYRSIELINVVNNRLVTKDVLGRYLQKCLLGIDDPSERYWIYTTAGAIGGEVCSAIIRHALVEEKYEYARIAAKRAAHLLGLS